MTMINDVTLKSVVVAGAAAEGEGGATSWQGRGKFPLSGIYAVLETAGLPRDWAPAPKSDIANAGRAMRALTARGYVVRRARGGRKANWLARWVALRPEAVTSQVGDQGGEVVVTAELTDAGLNLEGDAMLRVLVRDTYNTLVEGQLMSSGDVTTWLQKVLKLYCGATTLGTWWYVPARGRSTAERLVGAMADQWGISWMNPILPIATSEQLRRGIHNSLQDEIGVLQASFAKSEELADRQERDKMRPGVAAALLRKLGDIADRGLAYAGLMGPDLTRNVQLAVSLFKETLAKLTTDASVRFSLLEWDAPVATPAAPDAPTAAERAADAALVKRRSARRRPPAGAKTPAARAADVKKTVRVDEDGIIRDAITDQPVYAMSAATVTAARAARKGRAKATAPAAELPAAQAPAAAPGRASGAPSRRRRAPAATTTAPQAPAAPVAAEAAPAAGGANPQPTPSEREVMAVISDNLSAAVVRTLDMDDKEDGPRAESQDTGTAARFSLLELD